MKKIISLCLVLAILALSVLSLSSCGELEGKYTNTDSGVSKTYEFVAGRVKYYTAGVLIFNGEYTIDGEFITVKYTLDGKEMTLTESFFDYEDKIEIGEVLFIKE